MLRRGVFPQIWDYFCFNDKDPSYTGVRFDIIETEYTKIDLLLFHQGDFHPESPKKSFCRGGGWHLAGTNGLYLSITNGPCGGPHSIRYIDVATYGTDYIIFRAGDYYQDGEEHEFRFYLSGNGPAVPANTRVVARAIGYSSEVRHSAARDRGTPTRRRLCLSSPFRSRASAPGATSL